MRSSLFLSSKDYFAEAVDRGFQTRRIEAQKAVKSYLVSVLEFYLDARNLFDEQNPTLAEMYLKASQAENPERKEILKKLADRSLYISGFFADSLDRKIVDIDYYVQMGGAAYESLSHCVREDQQAFVYSVFSKRFLEFVEVLNIVSEQSKLHSDQNILRLYDRYLKTGSALAKEKLLELGVMTLPEDALKKAKQS